MRRPAVKFGLIASVVAALALAWPAGASVASTAGTLQARVRMIAPKDGGGEPSIAIAPDGTEYVSFPASSGMILYRSTDNGQTWTPGTIPQKSSGDTSVNTDSSGAVYESNLNGGDMALDLLQVTIFKSLDKGDTFPIKGKSTLVDSNSTGQPFLVDRQWADSYIKAGDTTDKAEECLEYHDFGPSEVWVSCSTDGGRTYGLPVTVITDPTAAADTYCDSIPGGLRIVQSGPHAGRIYAAWLGGDPANAATGCNYTQAAAFHSVWTALSDDGGATWTDHLAFDPGPLHDASEIFADMALDNQGNPYLAFTMNLTNAQDPTGQFDTWLEASFDGGTTWNGKSDGTGTPYRASCCVGTHYFPAIAVGDPGQVDMAWLRTTFVTPTTPNGKPLVNADANANWTMIMAQSLNVGMGSKPTWHFLTKNFVHHGDICTLGIFCPPGASDRSLLDFIDIQVDPRGFAHVVFTASNAPTGGFADGIYVSNQTAGPTVGPGAHS